MLENSKQDTATVPAMPLGRAVRGAGWFLGWACLFGIVYSQAPLYYSNQNQYFLHGLAAAGRGLLQEDWLANTADPTPLFGQLVAFTSRYLPEWAFHVYYGLLQGVYWVSLLSLFSVLAATQDRSRVRLGFAALLLLVHSAVLRWGSYRLGGADYVCYFQGWLAAQYVLGPVFQPSVFGVWLVLAVALFLRDRPFAAVASAALSALMHSTYLLPAGMLTLAFLLVLLREGRWHQAGLLAAWGLVLVTPGVVRILLVFGPTHAEAFAEAQRILVHVRIPHHCLPRVWFDGITLAQVCWIVLALACVYRTRLFPVVSVVFLLSVALTLVQMTTQNDTLALLFPWRTSVILLPLATAAILSRFVLVAGRGFDHPAAAWASGGLVAVLVVAGLAMLWFRQGFQTNDEELPLLEYVRDHQAQGDLYLLPVQVPNLAGTVRGSISSDFKPLPTKRTDTRLIPFDFQRFRLFTGTPIFVDFKAIPYKDVEVLEWHRRVRWNEKVYQERDWNQTGTLAELRREGITHVVVTRDRDIQAVGLITCYEDVNYRIYRVDP